MPSSPFNKLFLAGLIFLLCCFFCFYFKKPKVTACVCVVSSLTGTVLTTTVANDFKMLLTTSGAFMFFKTRKAVLLTVHMLVVFNMEEDKVSSISHWLSDQESDWWKQEPMKNV